MPRRAQLRPVTRRVLLGAVTGTALAGCSPGSDLPMLSQVPPGPYRLGVGDQLRMITIGGEQLTGDFRVDDGGYIAVPLLGAVRAGGLTAAELSAEVAESLKKNKLLANPSVVVEVVTYRPVYVLGEVSKPGRYLYEPGMTVLTAVSVAGGFTYRAFTRYVTVVRVTHGHSSEGRVDRSALIQPGDVVTVLERLF